MTLVPSGTARLFTRRDGDPNGPALVFANSLGTTLDIWDPVLDHLPRALNILRYDLRGHGQSTTPEGPYKMGQLITDAETVCDAYKIRDAVFVGLSVGGMIAQGLATKRLDLIRALVLSNTAARIGTPDLWADRIATIRQTGLSAQADMILDRWFGRDFRNTAQSAHYRQMLMNTPTQGYTATCAAISGTDFYTQTAALRLPTLGIAGSEDGATPPDLVRETIDLIPGSRFELIRRAGHLPCVEQPETYARLLTTFLRDIGHI